MLRRKLHESLTVRIFLITLLILLGAGAITFALIAWATPITYTAAASDDLRAQTDLLVERLSVTALEDCGPILDEFIRASKSSVMLVDANGHIVQDTNSQLSIQSVYEDESTIVTVTSDSMFTASEIQSLWNGDPPAAIIQEDGREYALSIASDTQVTEVTFAGGQTCELYVSPGVRSENLAVAALARMAPWVLLVLLAFSALCAVVYSRYITRPIVRLSGIAGKMAELDFGWICGETRRDEIGALGRSLDRMSQRLSAALTDLRAANDALLGEMERERELERQRSAFFAAASHELKTPVTILKGQLTGMLDEVGVYRDRDRYLARSLQVTSRMEALVGEILTISRMESGTGMRKEEVDLEKVREFAAGVRALLERPDWRSCRLTVPGDRPYRPARRVEVYPAGDESCTRCMACVSRCPAGAIPPESPRSTDTGRCISCLACVKNCPAGARAVAGPAFPKMVEGLEGRLLSPRREPELYYGR